MRHEFILQGEAFMLRPVTDQDAGFIVELRSNPELNRFIHATSGKVEDQLEWLADYYERQGDYYFIIERVDSGEAEGVVSVYDVDDEGVAGEWGRWILKPGSLAAVESALLVYRCVFEKLGLERVYCRTVADNEAVVSFHDSCEIEDRKLLKDHFRFGDDTVDAVEHEVDAGTWSQIRPRLEQLASLTRRRLQRA